MPRLRSKSGTEVGSTARRDGDALTEHRNPVAEVCVSTMIVEPRLQLECLEIAAGGGQKDIRRATRLVEELINLRRADDDHAAIDRNRRSEARCRNGWLKLLGLDPIAAAVTPEYVRCAWEPELRHSVAAIAPTARRAHDECRIGHAEVRAEIIAGRASDAFTVARRTNLPVASSP